MGRKVSVVIPTYDRAHLLVRAVESALAQTCPPDEIIVVDDGSTDDTAAVMAALINAKPPHSPEIRYFVQGRKGPSAARNRGIAEAQGEWIAFLDSDDLWHPEKLERQFNAIDGFQGRWGVCYTDVRFVNDPSIKLTSFGSLKKYSPDPVGVLSNPPRFIAGPDRPIHVPSLLARTALVKAAGEFDENFHLGEDHDFVFRLGLLTGFCYVNMPLVDADRNPHREIGMIELWKYDDVRLEQRRLRYEKWLRLSEGQDPELKKTIAKTLTAIHSEWANLFLAKGEYGMACRSIDKAVRYRWRLPTLCKWFLIHRTPKLARRIVVRQAKAPISLQIVGSGNSEPLFPDILNRSAVAGEGLLQLPMTHLQGGEPASGEIPSASNPPRRKVLNIKDKPSIRNVLLGWVPGLRGDIASNIHRVPSMIHQDQFKSFFYLTIDDGPSTDTGEKIRLLAHHKSPAVWFCVGKNLEDYPETAMQLIESGHVIGNHSYAHPHFSAITLDECRDEIVRTEKIIEELYRKSDAQRPAKLFRFPYGDQGHFENGNPSNNPEKLLHKARLQQLLKDMGFQAFPISTVDPHDVCSNQPVEIDWLWSYDIQDWAIGDCDGFRLSSRKVIKNLRSFLENYDYKKNQIILTHDHEETAKYFPRFIEAFSERGLTLHLPPFG
jgi:glycosyltransferase involved in cell wall biosynthesis/peptidoglycan/xylan/chitin deacetylase (PgdA/CDA1 family)